MKAKEALIVKPEPFLSLTVDHMESVSSKPNPFVNILKDSLFSLAMTELKLLIHMLKAVLYVSQTLREVFESSF